MLVRKTCHSSVLCSSIFVWFVLGLELGVKADLTQWKSFIGTAVVSSSSRSFARRREVEVRLPCAGGGLLFCQERETGIPKKARTPLIFLFLSRNT